MVGATEQLLGENLLFAQRAAAAAKSHGVAPTVFVEAYAGMWHDFIQESEGCGTGVPLQEAVDALARATDFLQTNGGGGDADGVGDNDAATMGGGSGGGLLDAGDRAPTRFHFDYNHRPPATEAQCQNVW